MDKPATPSTFSDSDRINFLLSLEEFQVWRGMTELCFNIGQAEDTSQAYLVGANLRAIVDEQLKLRGWR